MDSVFDFTEESALSKTSWLSQAENPSGMFLLTIAQRITQQNTSLVFRPMLKNIKVLS